MSVDLDLIRRYGYINTHVVSGTDSFSLGLIKLFFAFEPWRDLGVHIALPVEDGEKYKNLGRACVM